MSVAAGIDFTETGHGLPLVILHGGRLDRHHMIDALEPTLSMRDGYRRIYLDMPGHGASPADGLDTNEAVRGRLSEFIHAIAPDGPVALIGESRGGWFARALAQDFRDRLHGLCLIVPAREPYPEPDDLPAQRMRIADTDTRASLPEAELGRFDRLAVQSAAIAEKIRRTKIPAAARTDPKWQAMVESYWHLTPDPDTEGAIVDAPSLILLGRQDTVAGYAAMLGRIETYPLATVALLDCAGHALTWERPTLFAALLHDWLDRMETAQP